MFEEKLDFAFLSAQNIFGDIEIKVQCMIQFQGSIIYQTTSFISVYKLNGITMYSET